jgi:hypothetical protein
MWPGRLHADFQAGALPSRLPGRSVELTRSAARRILAVRAASGEGPLTTRCRPSPVSGCR